MTTMNQAMEAMMGRFNSFVEGGKVTGQECIQQCDESAKVVTGAFFSVLDELSRLSGLESLKFRIGRILEAGCTGETTQAGIFGMAKEIRVMIDEDIKTLEMCFLTDSADALRKSFHEDSIVEMLFKSLAWLSGKAWRLIKKVGGSLGISVNQDTIMGSLLRGVAGVAHVVLAGAKVVVNVVKYTFSIVGAGIVAVADIIWRGIEWLIQKIKGLWAALRGTSDDIFEEDMDDFFEEEFCCDGFQAVDPNGLYHCSNCCMRYNCPTADAE